MKRKNSLKLLLISLLLLTLLAVALTFIVVAKMTHSVNAKDDTSFSPSFCGTLENAYLYMSDDDALIICYNGKRYVAGGQLEEGYTGVADVLIEDGEVKKVTAKADTIEGTLDRYTKNSVQIRGYETLNYDGDLPVYVVEENQLTRQPVRQKSIQDLVVGTSSIRLVVADRKACAIIQSGEDIYANIRVLIKNKQKVSYSNLYVSSDQVYTVDDKPKKAKEVIDAKTLLEGKGIHEEMVIKPGDGRLYLCDADGKKSGESYEGTFMIRKEKEGYVLINELPVETYVRYVLPSEMPVYFDYEALKAQAVCARTFAYEQMKSTEYARFGANLDNTTSYQVYHASKTYEITDQAVDDTRGMVLAKDNQLISCYYYSTSPGYSENLEVWNADSPDYLVVSNYTKEKTKNLSKKKVFHAFISGTPQAYDRDSPYYRWDAEVYTKMAMDPEYGTLKRLEVKKRSKSGYVLELRAVFAKGERSYTKESEIRYFLGDYLTKVSLQDGTTKSSLSALPSTCFEIVSQKKGRIHLRGGGFGHGIGMSQYGADAMGKEGKNWQEILQTYYKDTTIMDIFDVESQMS